MVPKRILKRKKKQKDREDAKKRKLDNGEEVVAVDAGDDEMAIDQPVAAETGDDAGGSRMVKESEDDVEKAKKKVEEREEEVKKREEEVNEYSYEIKKLVLKEDRTDKEDKRMRLLEKLKREAIQEKDKAIQERDKAIQERNHAEERLDKAIQERKEAQERLDKERNAEDFYNTHPDLKKEWAPYVQHLREYGDAEMEGKIIPPKKSTFPEVYIRNCYKVFWDYIYKGYPGNIILGTPGIGKSMFVYYCVYKLLSLDENEVERIYIKLGENPFILITRRGVRILSMSINDVIVSEKSKPRVWIFVDSFQMPQVDLRYYCHVVVTTSPDEDIWSKFRKLCAGEILPRYMPPFTEKELLECNRICNLGISDAYIKERFAIWGGSARFVFKSNLGIAEHEALLAKRINRAVTNGILPHIMIANNRSDNIVHAIFHIYPNEEKDYTDFLYGYCSERARNEHVIAQFGAKKALLAESIMMENNYNAATRGYQFEMLCHYEMTHHGDMGKKYLIRNLEVEGTAIESIPLKFSSTVGYRDMENVALKDGVYYQPISQNESAIDALFSDGCLQYTISSIHGYKIDAVRRIVNHFRGVKGPDFKVRLHIVVPSSIFRTIGKQKYLNKNGRVHNGDPEGVEQYAMEIDVEAWAKRNP